MVRMPVASGMFYEDDKEELDRQITRCFKDSKFGPRVLPAEREDKKITGIIAPHAGYKFSGAGQAWCYKELGEAKFADVYVILGTSHIGFPDAAALIEDFETPFGTVKVDEEFTKSLINKGAVKEDKRSHKKEHSIEVQLPFLQFVKKDRIDDIKIAPIVVGEKTDYKKLGKSIAKTAKQMEKDIVLICSSDFTHHGIHYGYVPFKNNIQEKLTKFDKEFIKWIKKMDSWSFLDKAKETKATICGKYAIAAFIEACKGLESSKVQLKKYYSSGEVTGDWNNAVGYASIVVR